MQTKKKQEKVGGEGPDWGPKESISHAPTSSSKTQVTRGTAKQRLRRKRPNGAPHARVTINKEPSFDH